MDFFKVKKFRKAHKPNPENQSEDKPVPQPEEPKNENGDNMSKPANCDPSGDVEDEDDDFITNEVKRRLKELRRSSFMVLIPEESCPEEEDEEEEGETSSSEWRDGDAEGRQPWQGFNDVFDKYCERMLFFDRMSAQQLNEAGPHVPLTPSPRTPSPRSKSTKLSSPFRCLSLKKMQEAEDETEHLKKPDNNPYQDLETAYVAHICLTWEALHCQYIQLSQKISCQPENPTCYNHSAQQFQQFQVLLQRFIENEPFELGPRVEIYARTRNMLPKLLQVPNVQGSDQTQMEDESDFIVLASDLIRIIEISILTFHLFLKMDKKKSSGVLNLFGGQSQTATPLQQIQSFLEKAFPLLNTDKAYMFDSHKAACSRLVYISSWQVCPWTRMNWEINFRKLFHYFEFPSFTAVAGSGGLPWVIQPWQCRILMKEIKLKELRRKRKGWKKKSWPATHAEVEMLFGLIDLKVLSRVLRMERITKEQLLWCEGKMNKLELLDGKLQRDPSPTLFPC